MKNVVRTLLVTFAASLLIGMSGCGPAEYSPKTSPEITTQSAEQIKQTNIEQKPAETLKPAEPVTLTVSAAASLKDAMEELLSIYIKDHPNVSIVYNFASSGSLQQQIENGADVDVFVSAAVKQMNALSEKGLIIEETRKDFLENKIVLIVPIDASEITGFNDLSTDKIKIIGLGEPISVPVGQYSQEVLEKLNMLEAIKSKVVYGKDVKEVLTWVETGNADAGIVYGTDAQISNKVKIVADAPEGTHQPVYYPGAVIKDSKSLAAATAFTNFLYSEDAKPVFEKYGFVFVQSK